jgi:1-acyl-sn-glycerol-3-phosphate acyltransferase
VLILVDLLVSLGFSLWYAFGSVLPPGLWAVLAVLGVFLGVFLAFIVVALLFFLFVFVVFEKANPKSLFKHGFLNVMAHAYYNDVLRVKVIVTGRENLPKNHRFVLFSNHIEASDPMYIKQVYRNFPVAFVSKEVLFKQWPVKSILRGLGCVPISPRADKSALNSILESIKVVQSGQPMGIFPEGRRTYSNDIIAFKPGSFKLPQKAEADISPLAVYGMHDIYRKGRGLRRVKVRLHVLPLIPYSEYKDMDTVALAAKVQEMVQTQMDHFKNIDPR